MLLNALLIGTALFSPHAQDKVTLNKVLKKGEKYNYEVHGHVQEEQREVGLDTWLPFDEYVDYNFTLNVIDEKADGIVDAVYQRPNMVVTRGETYNEPEKKEKIPAKDFYAQFELSPVNEILNVKELGKEPDTKKPPKKGTGHWMSPRVRQDVITQFTQSIFRLAMFVGSPDSALDFNPKLPFTPVKVGATWKKTVGYSPQKLSGTTKSAVQRLDFVYTYKGLVEVDGKKYHRVTADLVLNTDAAEFINQSMGMTPAQSGLEHFNLNLTAKIEFDLRPETFQTQHALANTTGGMTLEVSGLKKAAEEVKFKGKTEMFLRSVTK